MLQPADTTGSVQLDHILQLRLTTKTWCTNCSPLLFEVPPLLQGVLFKTVFASICSKPWLFCSQVFYEPSLYYCRLLYVKMGLIRSGRFAVLLLVAVLCHSFFMEGEL